jgi:hypothetical protein
MATGYFVRWRLSEPFVPRRFGPLDTPIELVPCLACGERMLVGQYIALIPLGCGDDEDYRERAREKRWTNAVAVPVHYACATGADDEASL